jgi:hypothetical protein
MPDTRPDANVSKGAGISRGWWLALKAAVAIGIVAWILHDLDFAATFRILRTFPPALFALAMLMQAFLQALQAARWKILTGRSDIPYRDFVGFVSLGYVMSIISPSVLVSDSANAWLMGKRNQSVVLSISAMVAGRMLGMVGMFLLFLAALPGHLWVFRLPLFRMDVWRLGLAAAALVAVGASAALLSKRRPAWLASILARLGKLWAEARRVFARRGAVALALALSVALQAVQMTLSWLGFHAMHIPVDLTDVMFFVPLVTLIALVPGLGQAGVREGIIFVLFTTLPGVTREHMVASFGYSYALFAVMGVLNLGIAAWLLRLHRSGGKLYRWLFPSRGGRNPS